MSFVSRASSGSHVVSMLALMVKSSIGINNSIKCVVGDDGIHSELFCCAAHMLENLDIQHPVYNIINDAVQAHHSVHMNCCPTLILMTDLLLTEMEKLRDSGFGVKDIVSNCRDSLATMISHLIKSDQLIQLDEGLQQTSANSTHIKNIFEKGGSSKDESSCILEKNCKTVSYRCSKPDQNCSKPDQNCSKPDQNCSKPDQNSSKPDQNCSKPDQNCSKPDQNCSKPDQNCSKPDQNCSKPDQNCSKPNQNCSKPNQNCSKPDQNCSKPDQNCSRHSGDNAVTVFKSCSIISIDSLSIAENDHDGPLNCSKNSNFMNDSIVCSIRNEPGYIDECSNGTKQVNEELEARKHEDILELDEELEARTHEDILELDDILEYEDNSPHKESISGVLYKFENGKPADSDLRFFSSRVCDVKLMNIDSEMQKTSNHHKNDGRIKSHYSRHMHQTDDIVLNVDHTVSIADDNHDCGDTKNNFRVDHMVSVADKFKKIQGSVENTKEMMDHVSTRIAQEEVNGFRTNTEMEYLEENLRLLGVGLCHGSDSLMRLALDLCLSQFRQQFRSPEGVVQENLRFNVDLVHCCCLEGLSQNKTCIVDGLLLPANSEVVQQLTRGKNSERRALLINGDLEPHFRHLGHQKMTNVSEFCNSLTGRLAKDEKWLQETVEVISELNVDTLFVRGAVNRNLSDWCYSHNVIVFNSVPYKLLQALASATKTIISVYVQDCLQDAVAEEISLEIWRENWNARQQYIVVRTTESLVQTAVVCHPSSSMARVLEEQFWHCAYRLHGVLKSRKTLLGGGCTEMFCAQHLQDLADDLERSFADTDWNNSSKLPVKAAACRALSEAFLTFSHIVRNNLDSVKDKGAVGIDVKPGDDATKTCDEFGAKTGAWQAALHLACLLLGTDMEIVAQSDRPVTNFNSLVIGHL